MKGWTRILFILSVALNLLVAGVVIGGLLGPGHRHRPPPAGGSALLGPLGDAFSDADRQAMRQEATRSGADIGEMRDALRGDMQRLIAALDARPFDPEAVRVQLAQMRAESESRARIGEQVMLDRLAAMTDAERHAYANRLQARFARMHDMGERGPDEPPRP